jgi:hypothetical protein
MLISAQKNVEVGTIATCKLQNGQEVVGKVSALDAMSLTLAKPLLLDLTMDQRTGQVSIGMTPGFLLGADWEQPVVINRSHVTAMLPAADAIKNNYITSTTGLAMPGSGRVS